jgi:hypothetical protein
MFNETVEPACKGKRRQMRGGALWIKNIDQQINKW